MFNLFNTSQKMRGGGNRKTEIQNEGVGGEDFLFMYLSTIIRDGGQRGWGSWGVPLCPCLDLALPSSLPSPLYTPT